MVTASNLVKKSHQEHHNGFWKSPKVAVDLKEESLGILCHLDTSLISPDWVTWARMSNHQSLETLWNPGFIPENVSRNPRSCDFSGQATGILTSVPPRHTEQVWRSNQYFKELFFYQRTFEFSTSFSHCIYYQSPLCCVIFSFQSTTMEKYTKYNKVRYWHLILSLCIKTNIKKNCYSGGLLNMHEGQTSDTRTHIQIMMREVNCGWTLKYCVLL